MLALPRVLSWSSQMSRIVGYYTLSQTSVSLQALPEAFTRKLPCYPEVGATLIGRLARDIEWRAKEIGRLLLVDALRRCVRLSAEAGAVVVVTNPKDQKARIFYEAYGFKPLNEHRLFVPMKELMAWEAKEWTA